MLQTDSAARWPYGKKRRQEPFQPQLINPLTTLLGTRSNRQLGLIRADSGWSIVHEEPALLGGLFKMVLLRKGFAPRVVMWGVGQWRRPVH